MNTEDHSFGRVRRLVAVAVLFTGLALGSATVAEAALEPVITAQVKDTNPGPGDGDPLQGGNGAEQPGGVDLNGVLLFDANDGFAGESHGQELWRSDGTQEGTYLVKDIAAGALFSSLPTWLTEMNDQAYFAALEDAFTGVELWKTDGTEEGTFLLKDINPDGFMSGGPQQLTNVDGTLYFLANSDGANGSELWKSDGTEDGTEIVRDIESDFATPAHNLMAVGDRLFFTLNDGVSGKELWTSDGTFFGTEQVKDIGPGAASGLPKPLLGQDTSDYFEFEGNLYFRANDGVNGMELWRSDGTEAGTFMVKDIDGTPGDSLGFEASFEQLGDELFFVWDFGIYKTDGTGPGTVSVGNPGTSPARLTELDGTLYFLIGFTKLFKSDGTLSGTEEVFDAGSSISTFTVFDNNIYLTFDDGTHGVELWRTDGTASGTERLTDINPGPGSSLVNERTVAGDRLYFRGDDNGATGVELWSVKADRTAPETTIDSGPAEGETIETGTATFGFSSSEPGSTFECSIDGGPPEACDTGTRTFTGLAEGNHTFSVVATDAAPFSNTDQTPAVRNFTFAVPDTTAPALRLRVQKTQSNPRRILLRATCPAEDCRLRATGSIRVRTPKANGRAGKARNFKLRKVAVNVTAGKTARLSLRLSGRATKLVRRVLKKKVSRAKVRVVALDTAGNATSRSVTVKVRKVKRKPAA